MSRQSRRIRKPLPTTMTIRFSEKDADLRDWLVQFASTNDMSKVVKLACYLLSGLQPDDGLLALLQRIEGQRQSETEHPSAGSRTAEASQDALAAVMQELNALRTELARGHAAMPPSNHHDYAKQSDRGWERPAADYPLPPPATLPEFADEPDPSLTPSAGLDMARRRKRPGAASSRGAPARPAAEFDPHEMLRILTQTTRQFGQEYQGH